MQGQRDAEAQGRHSGLPYDFRERGKVSALHGSSHFLPRIVLTMNIVRMVVS